jgi:hypothetical protein
VSSSSCSSIDGDKGTDDVVGGLGIDSGDAVVAAVTFSIIAVMLLSIIEDYSCCCCCISSEVDVVTSVSFVVLVADATPITFTL